MNGPSRVRSLGSILLGAVLLAATLMLAAGTSQADRGGRWADRGGRGGGGGRGHEQSGPRFRNDGGQRFRGGGGRGFDGGQRFRGDGGRGFDGGRFRGDGGHGFVGGGTRYYGGGRSYGGYHYVAPRYSYGGVRVYRSYPYYYSRPHSFVSFRLGVGLPYYCPPAYRAYVEPYPVVVEPGASIEVDNYPPAGCYYYDPFCDRQFDNLDDYTNHIQDVDHPQTIDVVDKSSGDRLRTLEFVDGYWSVRK